MLIWYLRMNNQNIVFLTYMINFDIFMILFFYYYFIEMSYYTYINPPLCDI